MPAIYLRRCAKRKVEVQKTKIIVTQPLGIAAISVAERVAANAVNQLGIPSDIASVYMVLNLEVSVVLFSSLPRAFCSTIDAASRNIGCFPCDY